MTQSLHDRMPMAYDVSFSAGIRQRLIRLKGKVMAIGMGKELARVLAMLVDELSQRPLEIGEVLYTLRHIPMPVKAFVKEYISVVFVVHESGNRVMVTKMKLLSGHPFPKGFDTFLNK